jgi:uncharacterized protein
MPDLLSINATGWSLGVWSRDVSEAALQQKLTLKSRGSLIPVQLIKVDTEEPKGNRQLLRVASDLIEIKEPIFFENQSYEFEFKFSDAVENPSISHLLNGVQNSFRRIGNTLRGSINFGNDIGWFRLTLNYALNERNVTSRVAFEVFPTKMDMGSDLNAVNQAIDSVYPLWRFAFVKKTDQELARSRKPHERFPLLWLAIFRSLRKELDSQVKIVCNSPHTRLQDASRRRRLDQLRGKISPRLEERAEKAVLEKKVLASFDVNARRLSMDTPENRFVRMVLSLSKKELACFINRVRTSNDKRDEERVSVAFFNEIQEWINTLSQNLAYPVFKEVGKYDGRSFNSLVLHQRCGYSGVFRVWQQLKQYLDVFGKQASISVKSVAELYEVWCFLEIRRILINLGFEEQIGASVNMTVREFEKELDNGIGAAFQFIRDDGLKVRLAHEPIFGKPKSESGRIYSWNAVQKPDIVIEVSFPNGEKIHWLFDAKYRINLKERGNGVDLVPDDAINQMHRYRDALIYQSWDGVSVQMTRPFIGAFVIYPGWFENTVQESPELNPYFEAISATGIGAFPALPGKENQWLSGFFSFYLSKMTGEGSRKVRAPDLHLVQESVRIAPTGLRLKRDSELVFVADVGPNRSAVYLNGFLNGTARWYHTRDEAIDRRSIPRHLISDITYVAVATHATSGMLIQYVYKVKKANPLMRVDITAEQAGTSIPSSHGLYWLFELESGFALENPLKLSDQKHFRFTICAIDALLNANQWDDILGRYSYLYMPQDTQVVSQPK